MIKQVLKVAAMLMLIAGLTAASAAIANGKVSTKRLVVQVPFDFNVGDQAVPAGQYDVIIPSNTGGALWILNHDGEAQRMILARSAERRSDKMIAKLVFHRYGSTYFLAQAWMSGDSTGCEISKTKQERALERELEKIAANQGDAKPLYEVVEVIATVR
jgi:hypothetical protein